MGTTLTEGCKAWVCELEGKTAEWRESFSSVSCCSYERREYQVGEEILSVEGEDGCTKARLVCQAGGDSGSADIKVVTENICSRHSLQTKLDRVTSVLEELMDNTGIIVVFHDIPPNYQHSGRCCSK